MTVSSGKGNTGSWWHAVAKQFLKSPPAETCNNVSRKGKALGDKIFPGTENFSENNKNNGVRGWLWSVLKNLGEENHENGTLKFQLQALLLWLLSKKLISCSCKAGISENKTPNQMPRLAEL